MADRDRVMLECGLAGRPSPGSRAGDVGVMRPVRGGVLIAAIDGLGTGDAAARAAKVAAGVVRRARTGNLVELLHACHDALSDTRGVAMSLAFFSTNEESMTWLGVGSVEGRRIAAVSPTRTACDSLPLLPGLVGHDLPELVTQTLDLARGDLVVLSTDGVATGYADAALPFGSPTEIAEHIVAAHARRHDDALAFAALYLGPPA